jgi:hypothetical protein
VKRKSEETKTKDKKKGLETKERPKKEFKIEIVKLGKLEENTAGNGCMSYECGQPCMESDRNVKENFSTIDRREILARLASISIEGWNYKFQNPSIRHIGPMAQDFAAAFGVGEDDKHINMIDAFGVALASIQALYEIIQEKDSKISSLEKRLNDLKS